MKKTFIIALIGLSLSIAATSSVQAQSKVKKALDATGHAIGTGAKAVGKAGSEVGNKTAEVAVKGTATVKDRSYKGKVAPDGSNVYIDKKDKKYYINKKGKKLYLRSSQIKNAPKK